MKAFRFDVAGFLSGDLDAWMAECRHRNSASFVMLECINAEAMGALSTVAQQGHRSRQELVGALLLGRVTQSLQGAVLLAERGMEADARTLIRSAAETAIALAGVAVDDGEGFIGELIADADKHRLRMMKALLDDPDGRAELGSDAEGKFAKARQEILDQHGEAGPRALNLEAVARRTGMMGIYNTIYRDFSGDGAHPTANSVMRHAVADEKDNIFLAFEPRDADIPHTLSAACSIGLCALEVTSRIFRDEALAGRVSDLTRQWQRLIEMTDGKQKP